MASNEAELIYTNGIIEWSGDSFDRRWEGNVDYARMLFSWNERNGRSCPVALMRQEAGIRG
jgi:hypothetical protein